MVERSAAQTAVKTAVVWVDLLDRKKEILTAGMMVATRADWKVALTDAARVALKAERLAA